MKLKNIIYPIVTVGLLTLIYKFMTSNKNVSVQTAGKAFNNPGNIIKSTTAWQGKAINALSNFESFITLYYGYRAEIINLRTYYTKYGLTTLDTLIRKWSATDQEAYILYMEQSLNILRFEDLHDYLYTDKVKIFVEYQSKFEQGINWWKDEYKNEIQTAYLMTK